MNRIELWPRLRPRLLKCGRNKCNEEAVITSLEQALQLAKNGRAIAKVLSNLYMYEYEYEYEYSYQLKILINDLKVKENPRAVKVSSLFITGKCCLSPTKSFKCLCQI